jgi:hypothetical protein
MGQANNLEFDAAAQHNLDDCGMKEKVLYFGETQTWNSKKK